MSKRKIWYYDYRNIAQMTDKERKQREKTDRYRERERIYKEKLANGELEKGKDINLGVL